MQITGSSSAPPAPAQSPSAPVGAQDISPQDTTTPAADVPAPAVSVTLSGEAAQALAADASSAAPPPTDPKQVQIPASVLANMKAFETTSPTAYTDQIGQYASTINDAKASDADRLNAWTSLSGMLTSGTVYKAGNVADLQTALNATQTSAYAKGLMQLQNEFHTANVINADSARSQGNYGPQPLLDTLNSYSASDQQKIFVLMGLNQSYSDLDSMKSSYQQVADTYASNGQLTKLAQPTPAALGASAATTASASDMALTLLQTGAAQAKASAAQTDRDDAKSAPASQSAAAAGPTTPYKEGSLLSLVA